MQNERIATWEEGRIRHDYDRDELRQIFELPLPTLLRVAQTVHEKHWTPGEVQLCTLLSIKTGGCKEDCAYCPQSARFNANINAHGLLDEEEIVEAAKRAKAGGSTRFCMGAAWRTPPRRGKQFENVLSAVRKVREMGLEVCTTIGMLEEDQAQALAEAGVYAYNHNLDSSPEYYERVISTRTYQDRLETLKNVRKSGMTVCCGGIVGMGESRRDRLGLLEELTTMDPHPESVPINLLVKVEGTPLEDQEDLDVFELVRSIAAARIVMPKSRVRLSAGRKEMSDEAQALCFSAGANSIFTGEKLLTTDNPGLDRDHALLERLGLRPVEQGAVPPAASDEPAACETATSEPVGAQP